MIDEISSDRKYASPDVSRQEQLIAKYFGDVEERVRSAGSRKQAQAITDSMIAAFKNECLSEILPEFLKIHLSTLVDKYWRNS